MHHQRAVDSQDFFQSETLTELSASGYDLGTSARRCDLDYV